MKGSPNISGNIESARLAWLGQAGTLHAEGEAKVVWIDFKAEKSRRLPDRLRALVPTP